MRYSVDGWDPGYGSSAEDTGDVGPAVVGSTARVEVEIERPAAAWSPVPPSAGTATPDPEAVVFLDGVRRLEARVWVHDDEGTSATLGMAASWAAGAVCCCRQGAHLVAGSMRRGLFTSTPNATALQTRAGRFDPHHVPVGTDDAPAQALTAGLQRQLGDLEVLTALTVRENSVGHLADPGSDLVVVDGPLRGRQHLPRTVGYIKSHRAVYLPAELNTVVAQLGPGERTPVFSMGTTWDRFAWYLRLPSRPASPWTGVVRVECASTLPVDEVIALAAQTQRVLPRYASVEYKDSRAPQNLVPIAGLERTLRHRLGDQSYVHRALQASAR